MTEQSPVERIKRDSHLLRGTLAESLADPLTGAIREQDTVLIKFHGSYQQDDRDVREERRRQKLEPAYSFMIRTRLPGGVCTPRQWLALDEIARRHANGTLRLTTRQAFQFHGVIKTELKATMAALNATLIDTIAACGDVNRNVLASANPVESRAHAHVHEWAKRLSEHLLPRTRAYHEIWLDGAKVAGTEEVEPIYGPTYLPRKFKAAFAVPPVNDVDILAHDLGFIAIVEDGELAGFNVTVGGGLGATHGDPETYPRIADVIGFIEPGQVLAVAEAVVTTQRDFGNRAVRKRARLKYTIDDRGLDWFVAEITRRQGFALAPARPFEFTSTGDRFGWVEGFDGRWHLTLRIEAGRVADTAVAQQLTGLREIARVHRGDFRLTPNQNLIIANVEQSARTFIDALVVRYGLDAHARMTSVRRDALACVALPTCPLAMAEAERYLPAFGQHVERLLAAHGLRDEPLVLRITGCPNGCARPYLAEVALIG
ncbi:MAG: assimilatory sulfite reductase (NADPH) hemoprotein subunit, partial [Steroidobacteraceae bacterium]|nr:assimilatory sulfite reductase (NADPH) hemoprotein subunit [Steroidobacteraceae bacterium]